jgi:hypothetical protein
LRFARCGWGFVREWRFIFDHLERRSRDTQFAIIFGACHRVGEANERLRQPIHPLSDQFRMQKLMRAKDFHPIEDASFDVAEVPAPASEAKQGVVIRRPRARRQSEPGSQPVVGEKFQVPAVPS